MIATANVAPPSLSVTGITPSSLGQGATKIPVTITGNGFSAGATLAASGTGVSFSSVVVTNSSTINAMETVTAGAATGVRNLTVNEGVSGSATCTGCLTVTAGPKVTSITPSSLGQGATKIPVTITGTEFSPTTTKLTSSIKGVSFSSIVVASATSITALESVSATAIPGSGKLTVNQGDFGSGSCTGCLTVITGPKVTAITPSSVARGSVTSVTITGSGFATGLKVTGPKGVTFKTITVVSSTSITATMTVALTATAGSNLPITVTNSAAAGSGKGIGKVLTIT